MFGRSFLILSSFSLLAFGYLNFQSVEIAEFADPYSEDKTAEFDQKASVLWKSDGRSTLPDNYGAVTLVGRIPRLYFGEDAVGTYFGKVVIANGLISEVSRVSASELSKLKRERPNGVILLAESSSTSSSNYDVIYPGLIDLHNHPKQNNLPTWSTAQGQFKNRFEWSAWVEYKKTLANNMNPWVNDTPQALCSAFRWSELQAMILGTTYMQGFSSNKCVENFAINRVEDRRAFRFSDGYEEDTAVSAPAFVINPGEAEAIWNYIRPEMLAMAGIEEADDASIETKIKNAARVAAADVNYNEALYRVIQRVCPNLVTAEGITDAEDGENTSKLEDKTLLEQYCEETDRGKSLITYLNRLHKTITGRQQLLEDPNLSGIVAHASEGRHDDVYNRLEFPMFQLMGIAKPGMNLVHAVGLTQEHYEYMADNRMGVIWSPYSNLLLYGESLEFTTLKEVNSRRGKEKLLIALGSDWVPTGSKSVLEEVKLAKEYLLRQERLTGVKVTETFDDKELFKMMTEYPAKMIGHFHGDDEGEHGIGTIAVGAIGTVIVAKNNYRRNAFTNIVENVGEGDINLVVVDGNVVYGETSYLDQVDELKENYEVLPKYFASLANLRPDKSREGAALVGLVSLESEDDRVVTIGQQVLALNLRDATDESQCEFAGRKGFVHVEVLHGDENTAEAVDEFMVATGGRNGLNLNRASDIQKLLGALMMTQSRNATEEKYENMLDYFPSLYSCNDRNAEPHLERIATFISDSGDDESEMDDNLPLRDERYLECGSCQGASGAEQMQKAYGF